MRAELARLLREEVTDPRVGLVTLTRVDVAPDLSHALRLLERARRRAGDPRARASAEAGLDSAAPFLRRRLARRCRCGACPSCASATIPRSRSGAQTLSPAASEIRTMPRASEGAARAAAQRASAGPSGLPGRRQAGRAGRRTTSSTPRARWLGTRRVGHLGTLDPLATGVLPLAIRDATKLVPYVQDRDEGLRGRDPARRRHRHARRRGPRAARARGRRCPTRPRVRAALASFVGEIDQVPPMYSSVKQRRRAAAPARARGGARSSARRARCASTRFALRTYDPPRARRSRSTARAAPTCACSPPISASGSAAARTSRTCAARAAAPSLDAGALARDAARGGRSRASSSGGSSRRSPRSVCPRCGSRADEVGAIAQGDPRSPPTARPRVPGTRDRGRATSEGRVVAILELRPGPPAAPAARARAVCGPRLALQESRILRGFAPLRASAPDRSAPTGAPTEEVELDRQRAEACDHRRASHPRNGHGLARSAGRALDRADQRALRALQDRTRRTIIRAAGCSSW